MITAHGAQVIAYQTENGGLLCAVHAEELHGDAIRQIVETHKVKEAGGWSFSVVDALDSLGLRPLMRIEVQEWEAEGSYGEDEPMEMVCDIDGMAL